MSGEGDPPRGTTALRLGFYTGRQVVDVDGVLLADHGLGRVVNALLVHYPDLVLAAVDHRSTTRIHTEPLDLRGDRWLRLPIMPSFAHGLLRTWRCRRVLRELERQCDVVLVQLTFQAPLALLRPRTPRVYHLFSDVLG